MKCDIDGLIFIILRSSHVYIQLMEVEEEEEPNEEEGGQRSSSQSATEEGGKDKGPDFNYLLGMAMWCLTKERKDELLKQTEAKAEELRILKSKTPKQLWQDDLDAFMVELDVSYI